MKSRAGEHDEACWLVFLSVHFGKHRTAKWRICRDVYGGLRGTAWDWTHVSRNVGRFRNWLHRNKPRLRKNNSFHFGNHRKYQSIDADSQSGTGAAVESYVHWISNYGNHNALFARFATANGNDPRRSFDSLYQDLDRVVTFGRMAKFDYLTMLSKLALANIEPGSVYMDGATGPFDGARLLFCGAKTARAGWRDLDQWAVALESHLNLGLCGMQVMEDALCNWQKSPSVFVPFRG